MRVPIGDYPFGEEDREAIQRVVDSGRISEWREVRAFEEEYADYVGVDHCVAVSSGTAALICGLTALRALDYVPEYPRVLVPALTFVATANSAILSGYEVEFCDVESMTFCMGPGAITDDIDLVMPVHLLGYTAHMSSINTMAKQVGALVLEDAAEAHGAKHFGNMAGSMSALSAFSFYVAHTVQAGEFGVVCTDDPFIARAVRSLKAHGRMCVCKTCTRHEGTCPQSGRNPRFTSRFIGYNFKPMEFQAALARVQLSRIDENIYQRKQAEKAISAGLAPLVRKSLINDHYARTGAFRNVPMVFPIVLTTEGIRDQVMMEIESRGVECRPLFNCIPTQMPSYSWHKQALDKFVVSEYYGRNGFYVGCHQFLTEEQIAHLVEVVSEVIERKSSE